MRKLNFSFALVGLVSLLSAAGCGDPPTVTDGGPSPDAKLNVEDSMFTVDRLSGVVADGQDHATITITLRDDRGQPMAGQLVQLSATGEGTLLTQPLATDANGVTTGRLASTVADDKMLSASVGSTQLAGAATVRFVPGAAAKLAFVVQPTPVQAGATMTPALQVRIEDASGNLAEYAHNGVTLTLGNNPSAATLPHEFAQAQGGIATFSTVSLDKVGVGYTLVASADGLTSVTSAPFDVTAGAPSRVIFVHQPQSTVAGVAIAPSVEVALEDASGNRLDTSGVPLTIALAGPTPVQLKGTLLRTTLHGVASFDDLLINRAGLAYTLQVTSPGVSVASSQPFDIAAAAPAQLAFAVQPSSAQAGVAIAPAVRVSVSDAFGNPCTNATTSIGLSLATNPAGGTLLGATSLAADHGVATFSSLSIDKPASGYTLAASAGTLTAATSSAFEITSGAPARAVFTTQPTGAVSGAALAPFAVTLQDRFGNPISSATTAVTIALGSNPGAGTLFGTTTVNAAGGVATFAGISIDRAANGYTLVATAPGFVGDTSVAFAIQAAGPSPTRSSLTASSPVTADGSAHASIVVTLRDSAGNPVAGRDLTLTASGSGNTLAQSSGSSGLDGSFATTLSSTVAEDKTLTATVGSFTLSGHVVFVAGAPASLSFTMPPKSGSTDQPLSRVEVTAKDASGNLVRDYAASIALTLGGGASGATLSGTSTINAQSGVAGFDGLSIAKAGSGYTLTAKDASNPSLTVTSAPFDLAPGQARAAGSSVSALPSTLAAGDTTTLTVSIVDAHGNPVPNQAVSLSASGSSNTLSPSSGTTDAQGELTATLRSTTPEAKQVTAQVGTLFPLSTTVTFKAGPVAAITVVATPTTLLADWDKARAKVTATVSDAFGNPVPGTKVTLDSDGELYSWLIPSGATGAVAVSGTTDANGQYSSKLGSIRPGNKTVTATAGGLTATTTVTFVVGPPSAYFSTLTTDRTSLPADGTSRATLTLTLLDERVNPVPHQAVTLSASGKGVVFTLASGTTDDHGVFTTTVTSTAAGDKKLTATAGAYAPSLFVKFTATQLCRSTVGPGVPWPKVTYGANGVALGDVNGDGKLDLVTSYAQPAGINSTVSVFLGRGGGLYDPPIDAYVDGPVAALTTGDLDHDHHLDVAVVRSSASFNDLIVLYGDGTGHLVPAAPLAAASSPRFIASGDFDHDGIDDLVASAYTSETVHVWFGSADRNLTAMTPLSSVGKQLSDVAVGDLDGDGAADFLLRDDLAGTVRPFFGRRDRTFDVGPALGSDHAFGAIAIGDFDQDHQLDFAYASIASAGDGLSVFFGGGARSFTAGPIVRLPLAPNGWSLYATSVVSVDLDGNGTSDLIATQSNSTFPYTRAAVFLGSQSRSFSGVAGPAFGARQLAAGDLDGDHKPDLVGLTTDNLAIALGLGTGSFVETEGHAGPSGNLVASGDFDRDGNLDLVTSDLHLLSGNGDGTFRTSAALSANAQLSVAAAADFDRDGTLDLAAVGPSGGRILWGAGNGTFTAGPTLPGGTGVATVVVADFDGNLYPDLAITYDQPGDIAVIYGNANRTFAAPVRLLPSSNKGLVTGDFNHDGLPDLATVDQTQNWLSFFYGAGGRAFAPVSTRTVPVDTSPTGLIAGDFDGKNGTDLWVLSQPSFGDDLIVFDGSPFNKYAPFGLRSPTATFTSGDFDGDGNADVAFADGNRLSLLFGRADATFTAVDYGGPRSPTSIVTGDFDGDGQLDFASSGNGQLVVQLQSACF